MNQFDIPIFKKIYELYKLFYIWRTTIPKQDRYAIWQKCDNCILELLEKILLASIKSQEERITILEKASSQLSILRIFMRLMKGTRVINNKKYTILQQLIDEIGRMLGGWLRSSKY